MTRQRRRLSAWAALLAFAFVQAAAAAHACDAAFAQAAAAALASDVEAPCEHMGAPAPTERTGLCIEHCKAGTHAVDTHAQVDAVDVPDAIVDVRNPTAEARATQCRVEAVTARATAPPVFALSHRLRI
jgi:hypothetical protein